MKTHTLEFVGDTLMIECFGLLDAAVVKAMTDEVKIALEKQSASGVVVITTQVTDCPEAGKKELVSFQRLVSRGRHTAWVDERARFRGIALWVMHLAEDGQGKAVSSTLLANQWIRSTEAREQRGMKAVTP
jgi:anti-anti-sigma regulatory factor